MQSIAILIALVTLATGLLCASGASAATGNPCSYSAINGGTAVLEGSTWRMEVLIDEAAYAGPSIHDRLANYWNQTAKRIYRWTSVTAPIDDGMSTKLMTVSAAVIGEGLPLLERGDIVDVAVLSQGLDYGKGRASAILQRVCAARDKPCLDRLSETQDGKVSGVEIKGGDLVAGQVRSSLVRAMGICSIPQDSRRGEVAAALR